MERSSRTFYWPYLASALTMAVIGWGGLILVVYFTLPFVWWRWMFFALLLFALTGTALPFVWFLNLRFPSQPLVGEAVIVRQSLWVGIYGATLAWLQLGRVVTFWIIIGLAGGLILIEYLIRVRERSRWKPSIIDDQSQLTRSHKSE